MFEADISEDEKRRIFSDADHLRQCGNELLGIMERNLEQLLRTMDLCQYFEHKKLKGYADFFNSSSSFCCGVI